MRVFFMLLRFGNPRISFVFPLRFTNTFCYLKRHTLVLNLIFLSLTEWLKQVPDTLVSFLAALLNFAG